MKLRDLIERLKDLPPDTLVCVAEIDEAFAVNAARIDIIEDARAESDEATGREAVELGNGSDRVAVIRW